MCVYAKSACVCVFPEQTPRVVLLKGLVVRFSFVLREDAHGCHALTPLYGRGEQHGDTLCSSYSSACTPFFIEKRPSSRCALLRADFRNPVVVSQRECTVFVNFETVPSGSLPSIYRRFYLSAGWLFGVYSQPVRGVCLVLGKPAFSRPRSERGREVCGLLDDGMTSCTTNEYSPAPPPRSRRAGYGPCSPSVKEEHASIVSRRQNYDTER